MNINPKKELPSKAVSDFEKNEDGTKVEPCLANAKFIYYMNRRKRALDLMNMRFLDILKGDNFVLKQKFDIKDKFVTKPSKQKQAKTPDSMLRTGTPTQKDNIRASFRPRELNLLKKTIHSHSKNCQNS